MRGQTKGGEDAAPISRVALRGRAPGRRVARLGVALGDRDPGVPEPHPDEALLDAGLGEHRAHAVAEVMEADNRPPPGRGSPGDPADGGISSVGTSQTEFLTGTGDEHRENQGVTAHAVLQ